MKSRKIVASALCLLIANAALAGDDDWHYQATLYAWTAGLDGRVSHDSLPTFHLSRGFGDVLRRLDFGGIGTFEASRGRHGVFVDALHVDFSDNSGRRATR